MESVEGDAKQGKLVPTGGPSHPMQRKMQDRMNLMLSIIKETGNVGRDEGEIMSIMSVNFGVSTRRTKEYLSTLCQFGRLKKEGSAYVCTREEQA